MVPPSVGLGLEVDAPDHTTLCRFRNRLVDAKLIERLFAEFDHQTEGRGFVLKQGTMVDATLVEAACGRPPRGADAEGTDPDARFAKKKVAVVRAMATRRMSALTRARA